MYMTSFHTQWHGRIFQVCTYLQLRKLCEERQLSLKAVNRAFESDKCREVVGWRDRNLSTYTSRSGIMSDSTESPALRAFTSGDNDCLTSVAEQLTCKWSPRIAGLAGRTIAVRNYTALFARTAGINGNRLI